VHYSVGFSGVEYNNGMVPIMVNPATADLLVWNFKIISFTYNPSFVCDYSMARACLSFCLQLLHLLADHIYIFNQPSCICLSVAFLSSQHSLSMLEEYMMFRHGEVVQRHGGGFTWRTHLISIFNE
jgi:hypothetical protein